MEYQTWAFEKGLIDRIMEVSDFYDSSYIDNANQSLGEPAQ
jgi:hypothetical protein